MSSLRPLAANMVRLLPYPFELLTPRLRLCSPSRTHATELNEAVCQSIEQLALWMPWADHAPSLEETIGQTEKAESEFQNGSDFRMHIWERKGRE